MTDDTVLKNIQDEYNDIAAKNAWPLVYQKIGRECQMYPFTFVEAKKPQNKHLNRYRDVNPYDHSRIILKRCDKDYINANLVKLERANRQYILTQGPLMSTVSHFWLMVWEQKSRAILMLNKIIEKNELKCYWYWPQGVGEQNKMILADVKLTIEQTEEEDFNYYSTRLFKIKDMESEEEREVIHFHYTTWPDFGVPSSPKAFLDFLYKVRQLGALSQDVGPAVVHCSAGIGRSGTFCLVDSCLVIIEKEGPAAVSVQEILLELRKGRMGLIQTPDQLRFSYQAILEGMKMLDPNWVKPDDLEESIYSAVAEEGEEPPPPPPPRGTSLARAPARPLPAIPNSVSLENFQNEESQSSSSEEECGQLSPANFADDEGAGQADTNNGDAVESVRRRRNRELGDRVAAMKRKAKEADKWHALKRSLYKPITITFGVILTGIVIYSYVKH